MKAGFIAAFGFAATAAAQWGNIASCARTCRDNMVGTDKSNELGCDTGDLSCLCTKPDFIYGLRDCSRAICDDEQAAGLLQVGLRVCREAGVEISTGGDQGTGTRGGSNDETVSTVFSTFTSGGSTITSAVDTTTLGGAGGRVVVNTETQSDGSVVLSTTTIEASTTVAATDGQESGASGSGASGSGASGSGSGSGSGGSETGSATGSEATSGASATESNGNATETGTETGNETGTETGTETGNETGTETGSNESGTETDSSGNANETGSTTTSDNAGVPQMTAAPAGVLAAAGLAILLL